MLQKIKSLAYRVITGVLPARRQCIVCNSKIFSFKALSPHYAQKLKEYGWPYSFDDFETLNVQEYQCPRCGCSDRDRLYALYMKKVIDPLVPYRLLDIAPAPALRSFIKSFPNITYRSADLYMHDVDDQVDLTDMHLYEDSSFHAFICSHVIEHVPDDQKAMKELYRVLKPAGWGIAMVPVLLSIEQIDEEPTLESIPERWRRFGQDDHIRQFSKSGFVGRLKGAGFKVREWTVKDFTPEEFIKNGISPRSVLYIVSKEND
ncbi:methyltransferase domain-containing protein [Rufibacter quisquiliarum]|uniref:SAM-dependent methyltransferase n=1 Tax=Rufibacter quisquiliarum TaxID=1549639 RepID=A0A839GE22_9BACT|nr:methyltransferase domain-containing protein [Rufibacter quisquiliarum]MBA9077854.1 SAM-dependent methyltransferase [Rufibacter quisquiliarum]